ncbi:uncharacterized protein PFL1_00700 [Pseudozyma flocculosa PF-1]|uniref:Related to SKT5 - activator of chitin synthase III n=1 Tax=Pseudozyma flocculosa TaxID=84751 RepID=A0A5C3F2X5_9BASI|nr:uncharacterized protein PFL1_00700 [Pseudozyma flocculosa PF-1]EPQ31365.1 hypothetical protein PFL1_00700 [Pseudozyma flocculosa PF-1]SPO38854.1 related to SKT5 - activator of chitin synthase III [Pseudozyma flocculosa]
MSQDSHASASLAYASAHDYSDVPPSRSASVAGHYPGAQQSQQPPYHQQYAGQQQHQAYQQYGQQQQQPQPPQRPYTPSGSPYQGYYRSPGQPQGAGANLSRTGGSVGSSGSQQYYPSDSRQAYMHSPQQMPVRYTADHAPNGRQPTRNFTQPPPHHQHQQHQQPHQHQPQQAQDGLYRQSNMSMPALDPGNGADASRAPPLADDLGDSFANMRLLATPSFGPQRSKSPAPGGASRGNPGIGSVRANAAYANQEIHQSAAEVQPENSLAAIAAEIDQTAADLDHGNGNRSSGHGQHAPGDGSPAAPQDWQSQQGYGGGVRHHSAPGDGFQPGMMGGSMDGHDQRSSQQHQYQQQPGQGGYDAASAAYYGGGPPGAAGYASSGYQPHQGNGYAFAQPYGGAVSGVNGYDANPYFQAAQGYLGYPEGHQPAFPPGVAGGSDMYGGAMGGMSLGAAGAGRPNMLSRQGTQLSMASMGSAASNPRRKSKDAAPQQTLPFNKAFVNEYRQRMKGDPDPEAQFAFAKYLIEAAKKVHDPADGPKQQRKYRDALLAESLKLIKRLATAGMGVGKPPYAEAQFFLANCFGNGSLGLQVDHEKAYNLYVQASKQNHPAATYRTAVCNEVGAGTRRDHHRAVLFYRKASALGDTAGMYKLGMVLLNGLLGQPRNIREAIVWLKRAAAQADDDNPHALHELGLLHEKPNSTVVVHDEAYARELFTQAAQLGYAPSQFKLGCAYEYGSLTCPVDPRRSIAWYTKAAGKGDGESELALSGWYLTGSEGVLKQSDSEAYLWARRAATKGIAKAEYAVGYYSEVGIGVTADLDEAKRWYMRAAAQGNKRAMQRLTELKKMKGQAGKKGARPTRKDAESECVIA